MIGGRRGWWYGIGTTKTTELMTGGGQGGAREAASMRSTRWSIN